MKTRRNNHHISYIMSECEWNTDMFEDAHVFCEPHQKWLHICVVCGIAYHANRNSKTCSDKCRKQKSRAHRLHNASKRLPTVVITGMVGQGDKYPDAMEKFINAAVGWTQK